MIKSNSKKRVGLAKRLIALVLSFALVFTTLAPAYAREGNYGNSSAFNQMISGAYSGATASSSQGWGDLAINMATSTAVEIADMWYYTNYYSDYGKSVMSFDVGGTRVDISRGQMFRMVASVAVQTVAGLATGNGISVGQIAESLVREFVTLVITEIIRDILVRKFGMDPTLAGLISSVAGKFIRLFTV